MINILHVVFISFLIGFIVAIPMWTGIIDVIEDPIIKAIAECEASLPRGKHCEAVISARVKEQ